VVGFDFGFGFGFGFDFDFGFGFGFGFGLCTNHAQNTVSLQPNKQAG